MRHGARRKHAQGTNRKKLIEAGRAWAVPAKSGDDDLEYYGFTDDQPASFYLDHENKQALQAFVACATQWRRGMMGERQALIYEALQSVLTMRGVENTRETFEKVQLIEQGALAQMADNAAFEKIKEPKTPQFIA